MHTTRDDIPAGFCGLLFAPSDENAVYILYGLLAGHVALPIAFEYFEVDPAKADLPHAKWLDAKGLRFRDGDWQHVLVEFKVSSSGLRRDVQQHPSLRFDVLVCWIHDAPDIEPRVGEIVELRSIYRQLPVETQRRIILNPDRAAKPPPVSSTIDEIADRFSAPSRALIQRLVQAWPGIRPGSAELMCVADGRTVMRVFRFASGAESLLVKKPYDGALSQSITQRLGGAPHGEGVLFSLANLTEPDIEEIARSILETTRRSPS